MNNIAQENHYRERDFKKNIEKLGIHAETCMDTFRLPNGENYTPDFYLPQINCYVEVIGTRQAYNYNIKKYQSILSSPAINIMFITSDFSHLQPELFYRWKSTNCKVTNCKSKAMIKYIELGLCNKHYYQLKRNGNCEKIDNDPKYKYVHRNGKRASDIKCIFEGCEKPSVAKGLCANHYDYHRRTGLMKYIPKEAIGNTPATRIKFIPERKIRSEDELAKTFHRLRYELGLSVQSVALQMKNSVSFSTLYNFEHGMIVGKETKKEIAKWIDSKQNLIVKR
jgi:hypothetical protein